MTGLSRAEWEAANGGFLAASLDWLRLLLRRHAAEQPAPGEEPAGFWSRFSGRQPETERPAVVSDAEIAAAADRVARAEAVTPRPALVELATRLGLSRFERDTLLLCAAIELDTSIAPLCARVHGNERMAYPTFGLAMSLLPDAAWEVVSPHHGLRFWRLVEIGRNTGQGLVASPLRADERIVNYLKGLNYVDDRLSPLLTRLDPAPAAALPPSQREVVGEVVRHWVNAPGSSGPVLQLSGPDDPGKRLVTAYAATECGLLAYRLTTSALPQVLGELDDLARLWRREAALLPLALYLDLGDTAGDEALAATTRFLSRIAGPAVLATRESRPDLGRQSVVLDVEPPTVPERAEAWYSVLGSRQAANTLAAQFALEVPAIHEVAAIAQGDLDEAWRLCRGRTRPQLDTLAQRLEPKVGWDDIVLTDDNLGLLRTLADQVAWRTTVYDTWGFGERITRGLGVTALFAGPSGTGKTMAAEVVAHHLRLDLYRIDLSAVVSKYIGETEKNLRRLFDAADGGGAILLFDECDALFGKRSEVKDAHDRYANVEIDYLLQRMESYRGLAILATNLRKSLDSAFLRRLRFIVEFDFPGFEQRKALWRTAFPPRAPLGELDFDRLARFQVSGGMTRNIAVNAAFLAASKGTEITMACVLDAARSEFEKLDLPVKGSDFA
ncbi:ATP-binding protein [Amycolatopsis suaedae]|uniref:ATP-binding protein n=1 Tax=Amycolatopsis suaedae TaxID=2510978 RepID=A0A4Q7IWL1_9PSEU|nr:ATP-binding protein [Amycolatopsis suaedae]RZQ59320.1 ATP-binding protein [Amycolatopsis suaedae]